MIGWATTKAVWSAPDGALCRQHQDGACWAFIAAKFDYLRFGSYPIAERWRVNVVEAIGAVSDRLAALAGRAAPRHCGALLFFVAYPVLAFVLLARLRGRSAFPWSTPCSGAASSSPC